MVVSLRAYARLRNLPYRWLRAEVTAGRLPHLRVGRLIRVSPPAIDAALAERAAQRVGAAIEK